MGPARILTKATYEGVVSALTGNGCICTTLGPTGYHTADLGEPDAAHRTQRFVWAGRRRSGPRHPLLDLGSIYRDLYPDGVLVWAEDWTQRIDWDAGQVVSELTHPGITESTRSYVALSANAFVARSTIANVGAAPREVVLVVRYAFGEPDAQLTMDEPQGAVRIGYAIEEHLGEVCFRACVIDGPGVTMLRADACCVRAEARARLEPGQAFTVETLLTFSDREDYQFPPGPDAGERLAREHSAAWSAFWDRSNIVTGEPDVDDFLKSALYTLRCQATPWSTPPTLSEAYWGGGAFHDEMYPFLAWLATNHADLAERIPYFRLTTLPRAIQRARGRGALYPWSSTERGEERDPNGLWLTERFHLGQFAVSIWALWLAQGDPVQLEDLYPVLREIARYYELNLLEPDGRGGLQTRPCVDFDESVGQVRNGPFTVCAVVRSLRIAADAADILGVDAMRAGRWRDMAEALRRNLPEAHLDGGEVFGIPDGKPLHYSVLGAVFPFGIEIGTARARRTAERIHDLCRSVVGWKPGFSDAYEGSDWMWMAGHLAVVHAMHGDAERAWEAIRRGIASAGPFLSPNEHVDRHREIHVPWFTTGVGAWVYGLCSLLVQVSDEGTTLLPAVPTAAPDLRFRDLLADRGVLVSGAFRAGRPASLSARAPQAMQWSFRIPRAVLDGCRPRGAARPVDEALVEVSEVALGPEPTELLDIG